MFVFIGVAILLGLTAWTLYKNSQFRLVTSTPNTTGTIASSTGTFKLVFNRKLKADMSLQKILDSGDNSREPIVTSMRIEDKTMHLSVRALDEETEYSFSLKNVTAASGETIPEVGFKFTPVYIPLSRLSEAQKELEATETDRGNLEDPLNQFLPYQSDELYLTGEYIYNDEDEAVFIVNSDAFITAAEVQLPPSVIIGRYEAKVKAFIKSKGLDPAKYTIRTSLNEPVIRTD